MPTVEQLVAEETELRESYKSAVKIKRISDASFRATKKAVGDFEAKKSIAILEIQLEKEKAKLEPSS